MAGRQLSTLRTRYHHPTTTDNRSPPRTAPRSLQLLHLHSTATDLHLLRLSFRFRSRPPPYLHLHQLLSVVVGVVDLPVEIIAAMAPTMQLIKVVCLLCLPTQLVSGLSSILGSNKKVARVSAGPIDISSLGCGTWSWGNKLLWDYDPSQDEEIYRAYRAIRDAGVTIFDTADSYGTMELNGRAEILLGQFERRYQEELSAGNNRKSNMFDLGSLLSGNNDAARKSNKQQVATKFAPYPWRITRESLVQAARESLERLDQDSKWVLRLCASVLVSGVSYVLTLNV